MWVSTGRGVEAWVGACRLQSWTQAERKEKKNLPTGTGRHRHRQVGGHRQEWVWGEKCGHAQTGTCRWVQGGVWRHGWVHAGYNCEHKQKEKKRKTYLLAQVGRHRHRQVGGQAGVARWEWVWAGCKREYKEKNDYSHPWAVSVGAGIVSLALAVMC